MRAGACPCGAVRYSIEGRVRDVVVCHCDACVKATGGPWAASAAYRRDLVIEGEAAIAWERAHISESEASRGRCSTCEAVVFWDAPGRETVSFAAGTLADGPAPEVAAFIWVPPEQREGLRGTGLPVEAAGLPDSISVRWRD